MKASLQSHPIRSFMTTRFPGILVAGLLVLWALIELYPILFMFNTALKSDTAILNEPFSLAFPPSFESYMRVWEGDQTGQPFIAYFLNSFVILVNTIIVLLITSTLAGYALARGRFPGSPFVQQGILLALAVPAHTLLIPLYFFLGSVGLRNNLIGMILVYATLGLPLSVVLARAYFLSFPVELEEQAMIDGCSRFGAFWRVVVPMSANILATIAIVNVTWVWSELFFAQAFLSDTDVHTLPIAIASYRPAQMQASAAISQHFAIMSLTTLPLLIFYFLFQRNIRKGMAAGALR
jgi:raffinose/stachyose/melibiose transport system permease protein